VNQLDEVLLKNEKEIKPFDVIAYESNFHAQIKEDIKRHPYLYGAVPRSNIDIIKIASLIGKLFKSKKSRIKAAPIITLSYKELDSLFSYDSFFNAKLLKQDLKIPEEFRRLFFDYCDARGIDKKLLIKKNNLILLDSLMNASSSFKLMISINKMD